MLYYTRGILIFFVSFFFFFLGLDASAQIKSPSEFLNYELGERFTPHHKIVSYFKHLEKESAKNITLEYYGQTNELRPLFVAYIGSEDKISNLENIRKNNLKRAGVLKENTPTVEDKTVITWFSYNVHGNETSSSETAMRVSYELLKDLSQNKNSEWSENALLILDPCLNPDGRDRYVNWYNQKMNLITNTNPVAEEHHETWPSGRVNHYLYDLNRDWAWLTQVESKSRIALYNRWLPQVHIDFHEQYHNAPYYFAPGAEPFHKAIEQGQKDLQAIFGKNNADLFDNKGWLYFTNEIFDVFYPGYGDTYPIFNGAIGMTYELSGHGKSGRAIDTKNGKILTLKDRIDHHFTTSIASLKTSSENNEQLIRYFKNHFSAATSAKEQFKSYVISATNEASKLKQLRSFLDNHGIEYANPKASKKQKAFSFLDNKEKNIQINKNDLVVTLSQAKAKLVKVFFEPDSHLEDSITYDITAWALPYVYGLQAYALENTLKTTSYKTKEETLKTSDSEKQNTKAPYAYAFKWTNMNNARLLADLEKENMQARFSLSPFSIAGENFSAGSIILTKADNKSNYHILVDSLAKKNQVKAHKLQTGKSISGKDLGSGSMQLIQKPKIASIAGKGINENYFGHLWHYFEQDLGYPINILHKDYFSVEKLNEFNTLVLPQGNYHAIFNKSQTEELKKWVKKGGKIIAIGTALEYLLKNDFFTPIEKKGAEITFKASDFIQDQYADIERNDMKNAMPGAIYKVSLDNTHPLAFGYDKQNYYSLKTSDVACSYLSEGWNVGTIRSESDLYSGFVGSNIKENMKETLVFGTQKMGNGSIILFVDNPLFRGFWKNGELLFSNSLFFCE